MKKFIEKMNVKERAGLFIAAAFIAVVLIDRVIVAPICSRLSRLDSENRTVEKQLSAHLRNIKAKEAVPEEYKKYMKGIKKTGSDEEEVAKMLSEIEELARSSNVALADMKPQPPRAMSSYREYTIDIDGEGDEEGIMKFLYKLNASGQLLRAEKIRLYLKEKNSTVVKSSVSVTKIVMP